MQKDLNYTDFIWRKVRDNRLSISNTKPLASKDTHHARSLHFYLLLFHTLYLSHSLLQHPLEQCKGTLPQFSKSVMWHKEEYSKCAVRYRHITTTYTWLNNCLPVMPLCSLTSHSPFSSSLCFCAITMICHHVLVICFIQSSFVCGKKQGLHSS